MRGKRKDRVWRHNQPMNMHCGRCGGHVDGVLKREGPKWVFHCRGNHSVFKTLVRDKQELLDEGLIHKGGMEDPRFTARRKKIHENAMLAAEKRVYGKKYNEVGHHTFL